MRFLIILLFMNGVTVNQDWANLNKYKKQNSKLGPPKINGNRIVFMGNSITESWSELYPEYFFEKDYINRGIGGQTTPQMLIRFRADVIDLKPKIVVILAGTNDIAGNTGPATVKMITDNIISMAELARSNRIHVILSSILPAADYPWNPGLDPPEKIKVVNYVLKKYANQNSLTYLDYYTSMVDNNNELKKKYTYDGVHPNKKGYELMSILADQAISETLQLILKNQ